MAILLDLVNLVFYLPFFKVTEEDIGRNINQLKKQRWYQNYRNNEEFGQLIIYDKDVRQVIGRFNTKKLHKDSYLIKCQQKLRKVLDKKAK